MKTCKLQLFPLIFMTLILYHITCWSFFFLFLLMVFFFVNFLQTLCTEQLIAKAGLSKTQNQQVLFVFSLLCQQSFYTFPANLFPSMKPSRFSEPVQDNNMPYWKNMTKWTSTTVLTYSPRTSLLQNAATRLRMNIVDYEAETKNGCKLFSSVKVLSFKEPT